jgi:outer membrane protein OmpA-like peptidoglycan-associated protein
MKRSVVLCVLLLAYRIVVQALNPESDTYSSERTMTLQGRVVDELTKRSVLTSLTFFIESFKPFKVVTNRNGEFNATLPMASECRIVARAPGFDTQEDFINIPVDKEGVPDFIEIKLTPLVKLTLTGTVLSELTSKPIEGDLHVYWNSDFIEIDSKRICDGKFEEVFTNLGWYMVDFSSPGYQNAVDTLWVISCNRKTLNKDYSLKQKQVPMESISIEPETRVELRNIQFNFGEATFTPDSYSEMNSIVEFLMKNPTIRVEIGGHTDSEGPDYYNLVLSELRAKAVTMYLKSRGVPTNQLVARGYGETKPVTTNATEFGKAQNRRVELTVLESK